jgi:hypothetical protein
VGLRKNEYRHLNGHQMMMPPPLFSSHHVVSCFRLCDGFHGYKYAVKTSQKNQSTFDMSDHVMNGFDWTNMRKSENNLVNANDFVAWATGQTSRQAYGIMNYLSKKLMADKVTLAFPWIGELEKCLFDGSKQKTFGLNMSQASQMMMILDGDKGALYRAGPSDQIIRFFAGDNTLIPEIDVNGASNGFVNEFARAKIRAESEMLDGGEGSGILVTSRRNEVLTNLEIQAEAQRIERQMAIDKVVDKTRLDAATRKMFHEEEMDDARLMADKLRLDASMERKMFHDEEMDEARFALEKANIKRKCDEEEHAVMKKRRDEAEEGAQEAVLEKKRQAAEEKRQAEDDTEDEDDLGAEGSGERLVAEKDWHFFEEEKRLAAEKEEEERLAAEEKKRVRQEAVAQREKDRQARRAAAAERQAAAAQDEEEERRALMAEEAEEEEERQTADAGSD